MYICMYIYICMYVYIYICTDRPNKQKTLGTRACHAEHDWGGKRKASWGPQEKGNYWQDEGCREEVARMVAMWCDVMQCHVMWCNAMPCNVM